MSGMWKRSHGRTSEAPPDERGGYRYVRPTATAPHLDSTLRRLGPPPISDCSSRSRNVSACASDRARRIFGTSASNGGRGARGPPACSGNPTCTPAAAPRRFSRRSFMRWRSEASHQSPALNFISRKIGWQPNFLKPANSRVTLVIGHFHHLEKTLLSYMKETLIR